MKKIFMLSLALGFFALTACDKDDDKKEDEKTIDYATYDVQLNEFLYDTALVILDDNRYTMCENVGEVRSTGGEDERCTVYLSFDPDAREKQLNVANTEANAGFLLHVLFGIDREHVIDVNLQWMNGHVYGNVGDLQYMDQSMFVSGALNFTLREGGILAVFDGKLDNGKRMAFKISTSQIACGELFD